MERPQGKGKYIGMIFITQLMKVNSLTINLTRKVPSKMIILSLWEIGMKGIPPMEDYP